MKILAKTVGPTLVCLSGDFLDAYEYRIVEYDTRVRDWNNRKLLDIKSFIGDDQKVEQPVEEVKEVEKLVEEVEQPAEKERKTKKKSRR